MIALGGLCGKTGFDVAQTFPVRELGEGHGPELLRTSQRANALVATIPCHVAMKCDHGRKSINCANSVLPAFMTTPFRKIRRVIFPNLKLTPRFIARKASSIMALGASGSKLIGQQWLGVVFLILCNKLPRL